MARVRSHQEGFQLVLCTVGEKWSLVEGYYDERMEDVEDRGKHKRRNAPMEVDVSPSKNVENVAAPFNGLLGTNEDYYFFATVGV